MIGFRTLVDVLEAGYQVRAAVRNEDSFAKISSLPSVQPYLSQLSSIIVPDITIPGAYDEAVQGAKYIIHVASPLAGNTAGDDYESTIIQPAIQGTLGILQSSLKSSTVKRIVITASVASIASGPRPDPTEPINEHTTTVIPTAPFANQMVAYTSSKALSHQATNTFIADNKPAFDVINILPTFVIGRDETVTDAKNIGKGTNGLLMRPLLGLVEEYPQHNATVHVDDVARMHLAALDPKIAGGQDFLAAGPDFGVTNWAESLELIKKRYPKAHADGLFNSNAIAKPAPTITKVDSGKASSELGIKFKTSEEQVISVVEHYLELVGHK
ncbi:hypothetical protein VHEMI02486 [[Torrubiella] hemipterigena]|nr:hypothetical protein VHEMI02486 [[Torrubiella] hemipterigena]